MSDKNINIQNRKASFNFFITATYEAGIMLTGTEIKSVREGKANLNDAWCYIKDGEIYTKNMHISEYAPGSYNNHIPKRERKLLLNKAEIRKIISRLREKGTTIVPVRLYLNERGYAKLEIGIAKGKKKFDKRETIKTSEAKREMSRVKKHFARI
jgi:SsrA-binding protein